MNNDNNPPKDPMDQFIQMDTGSGTGQAQPVTPAPSDPVAMPDPIVPPVADPVMPSFSQPDPGVSADPSAVPQAADPVSFNITPPVAEPDAAPADVQPSTGDPVLDELHKIENKLEEMDEKL